MLVNSIRKYNSSFEPLACVNFLHLQLRPPVDPRELEIDERTGMKVLLHLMLPNFINLVSLIAELHGHRRSRVNTFPRL